MARLLSRRTTHVLLILLALVLVGTVVFLSAVNAYFSIDKSAIIRAEELGTWEEIAFGGSDSSPSWKAAYPWLFKALSIKPTETTKLTKDQELQFDDAIAKHAAEAAKKAGFDSEGAVFIPSGRDNSPKAWNPTTDPPEKIPRIIHQTWKDKTLPPQWQAVRDECARMHPDYEYMLWTDADSRQFIVDHYPWFISTFDSYPFPIQRADAIRYFILHYYGGIYMDLDVGCLRRFDPLLRFEVILPKTIPVGVSNDVMATAKGHPFMDHLIHNLVTFNHRYLTHYPTVMFSTGPMFVSASYGLYVDAHGPSMPSTSSNPSAGFRGIRVLPKSLYGKNAKPSEAPDAFFRHFYGSSWHANDADFLIFLRDHGRLLIFIGFCIALYGLGRGLLPRLLTFLGDRSDGRRRTTRRGRWISLPLVRDSRSGRIHSLTGSLFNSSSSRTSRARKTLTDEGTQTLLSPVTATGDAEGMAGFQEPRSQVVGPMVAAPRPQRADAMPLFQLRDGERVPLSDEEDDMDLGPGLNVEGMGKEAPDGVLNRMWDTLSNGSSRRGSTEGASEYSTAQSPTALDLLRSGSASKNKSKGNGVFYLPAYFVGGSSSSNSTTDSSLTADGVSDGGDFLSPPHSGSSSSARYLPSWNMTKPRTRNLSSSATGLSSWAANFFPSGAEMSRHVSEAGPALQNMLGSMTLSGRTPSPTLRFNNRKHTQSRSLYAKGQGDLESHLLKSSGSSGTSLSDAATARVAAETAPTRISIELTRPRPSSRNMRPSFDGDQQPPPPPYEDRSHSRHDSETVDDTTPTMNARRFVGRS